jgi:hypothetical protein
MNTNDAQQSDADRPKKFDVTLQKIAVAINGFGSEKNLQVSGHVADHEQKQNRPAARHEVFFAKRGTK